MTSPTVPRKRSRVSVLTRTDWGGLGVSDALHVISGAGRLHYWIEVWAFFFAASCAEAVAASTGEMASGGGSSRRLVKTAARAGSGGGISPVERITSTIDSRRSRPRKSKASSSGACDAARSGGPPASDLRDRGRLA